MISQSGGRQRSNDGGQTGVSDTATGRGLVTRMPVLIEGVRVGVEPGRSSARRRKQRARPGQERVAAVIGWRGAVEAV